MKNKTILLVGGTGFIGNELGEKLVQAGYSLHVLSRRDKTDLYLSFPAHIFYWDESQAIPPEALKNVTTIINLAGESIAAGRWTEAKKKRILSSRLSVCKAIDSALSSMENPPLLIQASAVGFYGDQAQNQVDEESPAGEGFLAETCVQWEKATLKMKGAQRKVILRIGMVLGTTGGALPELIDIYALGVGAVLGSGNQYMSWIHIDDLCRFIIYAAENQEISGVYNMTAPQAVTNRDFHRAMSQHFFTVPKIKVPSLVLKTFLGKKSELLLIGQKVIPKRTQESGFTFQYLDIDKAMSSLLGAEKFRNCLILHKKQWLPIDIKTTWEFFSSEKNLEKITPPWLNFKVLRVKNAEKEDAKTLSEGSEIDYALKVHGLPMKWRSKIVNFTPEKSFRDLQLKGPYKVWDHTHNFRSLGGGTLIEDIVRYRLPFGVAGNIGLPLVKKDVGNIFQFRRETILGLLGK